MKYHIGQLVLSFIGNENIFTPMFGIITEIYEDGRTVGITWQDQYLDFYSQDEVDYFIQQAVECREIDWDEYQNNNKIR